MHSRLIVLTDKRDSESSLEVRTRVVSELDEAGFCGEGNLFASYIADWFVIGGRWSGELTALRLNQEKINEYWAEFEKQKLGWTNKENSEEKQRAKAHKLFKEFFPNFEGDIPIYRDTYAELGFDDDAQILDATLLAFLKSLKQFPDCPDDIRDGDCFVDLDEPDSELTEDAIGKKWCVVVDFHH
jgi:hypothetical protein